MKYITIFLLLPFFMSGQTIHDSNHIPPDMGERDVVRMRIGPFLNNSPNAVAIHVSNYNSLRGLEDSIREKSVKMDSLGGLIYDYHVKMSELEDKLDLCVAKEKEERRFKFDYLNFLAGAVIGGVVLLTVKK